MIHLAANKTSQNVLFAVEYNLNVCFSVDFFYMIGIIGIIKELLRSSGLATIPEDSKFFLSIKSKNLEV